MNQPHMTMPDAGGVITVYALRFDGRNYTAVAGSESRHTTHRAACAAFNTLLDQSRATPVPTQQQSLWEEGEAA